MEPHNTRSRFDALSMEDQQCVMRALERERDFKAIAAKQGVEHVRMDELYEDMSPVARKAAFGSGAASTLARIKGKLMPRFHNVNRRSVFNPLTNSVPSGYGLSSTNSVSTGFVVPSSSAAPMGFPLPSTTSVPMGYGQSTTTSVPTGYGQPATTSVPVGYGQPMTTSVPARYALPSFSAVPTGSALPPIVSMPKGYGQQTTSSVLRGYGASTGKQVLPRHNPLGRSSLEEPFKNFGPEGLSSKYDITGSVRKQ